MMYFKFQPWVKVLKPLTARADTPVKSVTHRRRAGRLILKLSRWWCETHAPGRVKERNG
jgi:hypothetical protein